MQLALDRTSPTGTIVKFFTVHMNSGDNRKRGEAASSGSRKQ